MNNDNRVIESLEEERERERETSQGVKRETRKPPIIIGIAGLAGSGKSTLAQMLQAKHSHKYHCGTILSFASPIKEMLATVGIDKGSPGARYAMQTLGFEWGRKKMGPSFWLDLLKRKVAIADSEYIIIDDVRFQDEAAYVRANGYLVCMRRDAANTIISKQEASHASEAGIGRQINDFVASNNKTLDALNCLASNIITWVADCELAKQAEKLFDPLVAEKLLQEMQTASAIQREAFSNYDEIVEAYRTYVVRHKR